MSHLHCQRLAVIREEYRAITSAVEYTTVHWSNIHSDDIFILSAVRLLEMKQAQQNVDHTYIVRAFSEFEDILREEVKGHGYKVPQQTAALVNRAALMSKIPDDIRLETHKIREYRNNIVHQSSTVFSRVSFASALVPLNRFLARL